MKTFFLALTVISMLTVVHGQTMNKKEAQQFLEKSWTYVKMNDSISFANLWSLNDNISKNQKRPHSTKELYEWCGELRDFLDTALNRNLKVDYISIEKMNLKDTDTKYWIKAWFKYDEHYYKGYGFYLAQKKGKWIVRDYPSTSTFMRTKK